jgi:putative endonuclease
MRAKIATADPHSAVARGAIAESIAASHIERQGLTIAARNFRTRFGEVDLVAQDNGLLVFIEVRLRKEGAHGAWGGAVGSVTARKQHRIALAAAAYLQRFREPPPCRFDVIALNAGGDVETWIKGAFEAPANH